MNTQEIIKEAENYYKLNLEYFTAEYNGMNVKIRMNKNHSRNHSRNDDNDTHNLSLVNVKAEGSNQNSYFEYETSNATYIQKQVFSVFDWEDAKNEILDFLNDIDFKN